MNPSQYYTFFEDIWKKISDDWLVDPWPTGNGSTLPFSNNNPAPGGPRDSTYGSAGRPNGRAPGNGAPPASVTGPPTAAKSSVTISNGRDPRRAKRWNQVVGGDGMRNEDVLICLPALWTSEPYSWRPTVAFTTINLN